MGAGSSPSARCGGGVNGTAILEAGWHIGIVLFVTPPFARCLLRHRSALVVALGVVIGGAAYHLLEYPSG